MVGPAHPFLGRCSPYYMMGELAHCQESVSSIMNGPVGCALPSAGYIENATTSPDSSAIGIVNIATPAANMGARCIFPLWMIHV